MSHSYGCLFLHIIWTTKKRVCCIVPELKDRMYSYIGTIVKEANIGLLAIGGTENHVHMLVKTEGKQSVPDLMRVIKTGSSKFMNRLMGSYNYRFEWQTGYGVFSIGPDAVERVCRYICNQEVIHKKRSLDEEFGILLKRYNNV